MRSFVRWGGSVGLALLLPAMELAAQTGTVSGVVTDSLNRRRLAGAQVSLSGLDRVFTTNAGGRFTADSVPPGHYQVSFRHPVLDSLGVRSAAVPIDLAPGGSARVLLGVPSGRTFMRLCPADPAAQSRAALFGVVRNAVTSEPLPGVAIAVKWGDVVVDPVLGPRRQMQVENATTDSIGFYTVCNLPPKTTVTATATKPGFIPTTGDATLRSEEAVTLHLIAAPENAPSDAVLAGRVMDVEKRPLANADVWTVNGAGMRSRVARTDSAGRFTLDSLTPGTSMVAVRRIGSAPLERTVTLAAARRTDVDLVLPSQAFMLPEVKVEAKAGRAALSGFGERRQRGFGKFYDPSDLERLAATYTGDIFRQLPSVRLEQGFGTESALVNQSRRGTTGQMCAMALLVNGVPTPPDAMLSVPKEEIDGIEVFDSADRVPMEYSSPATNCGAVLIWTKH